MLANRILLPGPKQAPQVGAWAIRTIPMSAPQPGPGFWAWTCSGLGQRAQLLLMGNSFVLSEFCSQGLSS